MSKGFVQTWGRRLEAELARDPRHDPRAGEISIGAWQSRVAAATRRKASAPKRESLWSVHCEPKWAGEMMAGITRLDAQSWVNDLTETHAHGREQNLSAETVTAIVHVMSGLYEKAMREVPPIVTSNPFAKLDLPVIEPRPVQFYERPEAAALYECLGQIDPKWRVLGELGHQVGLRFEEITGLHGHRVDWLRGRVEVVDVMTRQGLRQWPKSRKSHRVVPVPQSILEGMSALMVGRDRADLVFTAPHGGPVSDGNFRKRVWYPAVAAAGVRKFPPRIMRHTAASWLVQAGVPLYDVQALLGHESFTTTQRYAHLAPDAHEKVIAAWQSFAADPPVTHERSK